MIFEEAYGSYLHTFEAYLKEYSDELDCKPAVLKESMLYSLNAGGKRVRPVLMLAVHEMLGGKTEDILPFALALEMIHTYTLIHDDLPAMDNDDFRRGKPSNHKVFGEGNAILAGDALLNTAFEVLLKECLKGKDQVLATRYIIGCSGIYGTIAGQSADLLYTQSDDYTEDTLNFIYRNKTGRLLSAAVMAPCFLARGKHMLELDEFSDALGTLFQLTDDILDEESTFQELGKSVGKDKEENKLTAIKLYGLSECKIRADLLANQCKQLAEGIDEDTAFLQAFVTFVHTRRS